MSTFNGQPLIPGRLLASGVSASDTIASTNVETAFASTVTILANSLRVGDVIEVFCAGVYSTTGAPTHTFEFAIGATSTSTTGVMAAVSNSSNVGWQGWMLATVTAIGAAGTFEINGEFRIHADTAGNGVAKQSVIYSAPMTVDTTAAMVVSVRQKWDVSNAANTITLRQLVAKFWPKN